MDQDQQIRVGCTCTSPPSLPPPFPPSLPSLPPSLPPSLRTSSCCCPVARPTSLSHASSQSSSSTTPTGARASSVTDLRSEYTAYFFGLLTTDSLLVTYWCTVVLVELAMQYCKAKSVQLCKKMATFKALWSLITTKPHRSAVYVHGNYKNAEFY